MTSRVCVSIAESSPKKVYSQLRKSLADADYAEIRLDFLKPSQIPFCLTIVRSYLKRCICTLRPVNEGGKFQGSEKERLSILKLVAEFDPHILDVEYNTLKNNPEFAKYLKKTKTNVMVSWHDFNKTPDGKNLRIMLKKMSRYSNNVKIVTTSKSIRDTIQILSLYKIKPPKVNLICFAMGDYGRMSRILCTKLGSPLTYASLGKPVAPGQFSLKEMKGILRLDK